VKLAVFTSRYPAQVATFFERDMRSLVDAGIEIDVFSVAPFDPSLWKHALPLLGPDQLPRDRVYHLGVLDGVRGGIKTLLRRDPTARRDARAILASATQYGLEPFAKTAYVLPKAWAWAARARKYDHVLAYWGNYAGTCAYAFHRLAMPHVPFSIWLHAGSDLYFDTVFLREKLLYADNIITCCEFNVRYLAREFADVMPQIASKLLVNHHGLDLSAFTFRPEGRPQNRVIAVGRLAKEKGYDYLVRAAQLLATRGVDVLVDFVGHGRDEERLVSLARELGVSDRVRFRGWLPFAEVRKAMSEATVLVHPSNGLGDGLPNVLREAMGVGTPVIASDVAGIPDALNDGCGVLVPPKDVPALANAIAALLADPARRIEMATRARQRVEQHYDLARNGIRLARVLRSTKPRSAGRAVGMRSGSRSQRSYDLVALDLLVTPKSDAVRFDHDELDWSELRQAAQRGGALVRVADAVKRPGEPLPTRFAEAVAKACQRTQQIVDVVDQLSDVCTRLGLSHAFVRTAECYPDAPAAVNLLIGEPSPGVDRDITHPIHAVRERGSLHHRLAGVSTYRMPYGNQLLIRHGRLGRLGEHARFARLLLARAECRSMGTATPRSSAPADHLVVLAMHQVYTRPEFRLSDLHGAIMAVRGTSIDWDYVFATALSTSTLPAVGCYLEYLARMYRSVSDDALVPEDVLRRFAASSPTPAPALVEDRGFPRTWSAVRLYWQHLRATLESGRWHSAVRLSLVPVMAALTAGGRASGGARR